MRVTGKLIITLLLLSLIMSGYAALAATPAAGNATQPASLPACGIVGTIYDAAGNLVPGADVYLKDGRGAVIGLTLTDGNGTYTYTELTPGNYTVLAQIDGYSWFGKKMVNTGNTTVIDVYIPDYVHWPAVTPWPAIKPAGNNSTSAGSTKVVTATPSPVPVPAQTNTTIVHTAPDNMDTVVENLPAGSDEIDGGSSPIDDIINGIVGFFQSLFGMGSSS